MRLGEFPEIDVHHPRFLHLRLGFAHVGMILGQPLLVQMIVKMLDAELGNLGILKLVVGYSDLDSYCV